MLGFLSSAGRPLHSDSWEENQVPRSPSDVGVSTGDKTVTEAGESLAGESLAQHAAWGPFGVELG